MYSTPYFVYKLTYPVEELPTHVEMEPADFMNPHYILSLIKGEDENNVCDPTREKLAFNRDFNWIAHMYTYNFHVSREKMSLAKLLSCIRKMILYPTNNAVLCKTPIRHYDVLFQVACKVTDTTDDGEVYSAEIIVAVFADSIHHQYLVEARRCIGNREIFARFFETLQYYIERGGTVNPSMNVHCGKFIHISENTN